MRRILIVVLSMLGSPAGAVCLSDAQIDAALGPAIRFRASVIDTGRFYGQPLCSGLTLAQAIQKMRDSAFPEERTQREAEAARLAAAEPPRPAAFRADPQPARTVALRPAVATASGRGFLVTTASAGLSLDGLLDRAVLADSRSWMMNRYIVGSMRGARYVSGNKAKTTYVARGIYDYSGFGGARTGWVVVKVVGGDLSCFEYHDQPGVCRRPWASLGQQNMLGLAGAMMSGNGRTGGSGGRDDPGYDAFEQTRDRDRAANAAPAPAPPPVTPIGGANGLYGCASPPCM